jgi:hypothetical protein
MKLPTSRHHTSYQALPCRAVFSARKRSGWPRTLGRCRPNVYLVVKFALGLGLLLDIPGTVLAAGQDPSVQPLYDIVAVGRGRDKILLATLASPADKLEWRFRKIQISPPDSAVDDVELSADGTNALVVFHDGTARVFDLTKRITSIGASDPSSPQHRLPQERFPILLNGEVCMLDDLGDRTREACTDAKAAVVHEDGRVLYALNDGRLVVVAAGGAQEQLAYRLPPGTQFQLLAGHRGATRDFLILVNHAESTLDGKNTSLSIEIIDPRLPDAQLGQFANLAMAALRAQLAFDDPITEGSDTAHVAYVSQATLATLSARLDQGARPDEIVWSFYHLTVNAELYAPVLEFAPGEPDYPSDFDIWEEIRPLAHGNSRQAYEAAYVSMGDRRWSHCTSYVRTLSYPGTWLIEYWFYYPFDEGKPHPHIHDSEHMFVEVDKLGGTVRNIFASDHDSFVPNNIFSTLVKDSPPVTLPLFAMVERAKHAMAPDLNHDGRFTPGIDDNLHHEPYSFWGIRDRSNRIHVLMEPYRASMSVPRNRDGRFALADGAALFPDLDVPSDHQVCSLQPFPDDPPCSNCNIATAAAGTTHLVNHPDARVPENIYKPFVLPWREVRVGIGLFDFWGSQPQLYTALAGDLPHLTGGFVRAPVRLALEFMWSPFGHAVSPNIVGQLATGARLERMVTNTQGFYFGVTPQWEDISTHVGNGVASSVSRQWLYSGVWYRIGYVLELPSEHKGNFTNDIGLMFQSSAVRFEWRVSLGILRRRGRRDFGARPGDHNPYQ